MIKFMPTTGWTELREKSNCSFKGRMVSHIPSAFSINWYLIK